MAENRGSTGYLGVVLGGVVAVAAIVFLLSGGDLGGVKKIEGDHDLPPVVSTPPRK
jgi:hypothetical protein